MWPDDRHTPCSRRLGKTPAMSPNIFDTHGSGQNGVVACSNIFKSFLSRFLSQNKWFHGLLKKGSDIPIPEGFVDVCYAGMLGC